MFYSVKLNSWALCDGKPPFFAEIDLVKKITDISAPFHSGCAVFFSFFPRLS